MTHSFLDRAWGRPTAPRCSLGLVAAAATAGAARQAAPLIHPGRACIFEQTEADSEISERVAERTSAMLGWYLAPQLEKAGPRLGRQCQPQRNAMRESTAMEARRRKQEESGGSLSAEVGNGP